MPTTTRSVVTLALLSLIAPTLPVEHARADDTEPAAAPAVENGDVNGSGKIDVADAIYLIDYLFNNGAPPVGVPAAAPARTPVMVYLVRHAEDNKDDPDAEVPIGHLTPEGQARAEILAERFRQARVDRVLSSHKIRTFETVLPLAEQHGLVVEQFPPLGSMLDGEMVTEETSTGASVDPAIEALLALPPGSVAVIAGHSSTLFAIMAGLGVPVGTEAAPCSEGDTSCLPCTAKSCFPETEFDNLWVVTLPPTPAAEAAMTDLRYGDPCLAEVEM